ncbi:MAG: endonuclease III [Chloroflexota bacterium]|nr:endonuclease III [Chloroflexota bacterium]
MTTDALTHKALEIHRRLLNEYGEPQWLPGRDPIALLVSTIISQNTNDINRDVAYARLRESFPTWEQVRDAPADGVVEAIRPAGLAPTKGPRIQEALRVITRERGELTLDFLSELSLDQAKAWLARLNGVGPKTVAIVLLFALGMPAFPVDTHVHRVSKRLGLIGARVSREKAHTILEEMMPPDIFYAFHLNLIDHGRQVCHAHRPRCEVCVLRDLCDYYTGLA